MQTQSEKRNSAALEESRDYTVAISNDLIQHRAYHVGTSAGKSPSVTAHKLFLYLVSKIRPEDKMLQPITFSTVEFCNLTASKWHGVYQMMKDAISELASLVFWLDYGDHDTLVHIVDKVDMYKGKAVFTVVFRPEMHQYLIQLQQRYTSFPLQDVLLLRSKYSILLFQLLASYVHGSRYKEFEVQSLRACLDATDPAYDVIGNFRARVLDKAIDEINHYTMMKVSYTRVMNGRSITHFVFNMKDLRASTHPDDVDERIRRQEEIDLIYAKCESRKLYG